MRSIWGKSLRLIRAEKGRRLDRHGRRLSNTSKAYRFSETQRMSHFKRIIRELRPR